MNALYLSNNNHFEISTTISTRSMFHSNDNKLMIHQSNSFDTTGISPLPMVRSGRMVRVLRPHRDECTAAQGYRLSQKHVVCVTASDCSKNIHFEIARTTSTASMFHSNDNELRIHQLNSFETTGKSPLPMVPSVRMVRLSRLHRDGYGAAQGYHIIATAIC